MTFANKKTTKQRNTKARKAAVRSNRTLRSKKITKKAVAKQVTTPTKKATTKATKKATTKKPAATKKTTPKKQTNAKAEAPTYISIEDYGAWEKAVIKQLESSKPLKSASAIYLLQRLYIVLDSDTDRWTAVDEKKNGRIFEMCDANTGESRTYFYRSPHHRRSAQLTQYVATDLRSVRHYTVVNNDAKWIGGIPTFKLTNKAFQIEGKDVKADKFATEVLKAFFATQKSNAKSLTAKNDPSKDKAVIKGLVSWFTSVQSIMNDDTVVVKLAYATFNAERTPNRTDPLRLFVPAKKVTATMKTYYVKERDPDTREMRIRTCKKGECDAKYLAVDVDDNKNIVEDAHLSINEPEMMIQYQAVKQ